MNKGIKIRDVETGEINEWSMDQVLEEINSDRSENWSNYDSSDWREGWLHWVEGEYHELVRENESDNHHQFEGMSQTEVVNLIIKNCRIWADEEAMENKLNNAQEKERFYESLEEIIRIIRESNYE